MSRIVGTNVAVFLPRFADLERPNKSVTAPKKTGRRNAIDVSSAIPRAPVRYRGLKALNLGRDAVLEPFAQFIGRNERAASAVLLGASAAPMLVGLPGAALTANVSSALRDGIGAHPEVIIPSSTKKLAQMPFRMGDTAETYDRTSKEPPILSAINVPVNGFEDRASNEQVEESIPSGQAGQMRSMRDERTIENLSRWRNYQLPQRLAPQMDTWRQTQEGNCSAVAVIKAAADHFGPQVFQSVRRSQDGEGFEIKMRDGHERNLTDEELRIAEASSRFEVIHDDTGVSDAKKTEALDFANFTYAAMAKRALENKVTPDGRALSSFEVALDDLEDGDWPLRSVDLLGLRYHFNTVDVVSLENRDSVVAYSAYHAVFVDQTEAGRYEEDNWGKRETYDMRAGHWGEGVIQAFAFGPVRDTLPARGFVDLILRQVIRLSYTLLLRED